MASGAPGTSRWPGAVRTTRAAGPAPPDRISSGVATIRSATAPASPIASGGGLSTWRAPPEDRGAVAGPDFLAREERPDDVPGLARAHHGLEQPGEPAPGGPGPVIREPEDVEGRVRRQPHSSSSPKVVTEKAGW